jgi:hypothetical protein
MLVHKDQFFGAIRQVKEAQWEKFRWDPFRPHTIAANLLYLSIIERIPASLGHDLGIYAAVGTTLDHYGMDAFVMTRNIVVGIDLTVNRNEEELTKKRIWTTQAAKIGRPIVIVEMRHLEREDGIDLYGTIIAGHVVRIFEKHKRHKVLRRLRPRQKDWRHGHVKEFAETLEEV